MKPIRAQIDIARPHHEVFDYLSDIENDPAWRSGVTSSRWTSPLRLTVGSTWEQHARALGPESVTRFEVTELEPGHLITSTSSEDAPFPITVTRRVDALGPRYSVVTETTRIFGGAYFLLAPLAHGLAQSRARRDYKRLKKLLEAHAGAVCE